MAASPGFQLAVPDIGSDDEDQDDGRQVPRELRLGQGLPERPVFVRRASQPRDADETPKNRRTVSFADDRAAPSEAFSPTGTAGDARRTLVDDDDAAEDEASPGGRSPVEHRRNAFPSTVAPKGMVPRFGNHYYVGAFHAIAAYALKHFHNVFQNSELNALRAILQLSPQAKDLILRLASRKPLWFSESALNASYGHRIHVSTAIDELAKARAVVSMDSSEVAGALQADAGAEFGRVPHRLQELPPSYRSADALLSVMNVDCLREVATSIRSALHSRRLDEIREQRRTAGQAPLSEASLRKAVPFEDLPTTRRSLMNRIVGAIASNDANDTDETGGSSDAATAAFYAIFDDLAIRVVSLAPWVRDIFTFVTTCFNLVSGFTPSAGGGSGNEAPLPPTSAVFSSIGVVRFPALALLRLPYEPDFDSASLGLTLTPPPADGLLPEPGVPRHMQFIAPGNLFRSRRHFNLYLEALRIEVGLFEELEGPSATPERRQAARSLERVLALERHVMLGITRCAQLLLDDRQRDRVGAKRQRKATLAGASEAEGNVPESDAISDLLRTAVDPVQYPHALRFVPLVRWLHLAEQLYPLFEYNKDHHRALFWIRVLLGVNVHPTAAEHPLDVTPQVIDTLISALEDAIAAANRCEDQLATGHQRLALPVPMQGFPCIPYRHTKRGEWRQRIVQNLDRGKLKNALEMAEEIHQEWVKPEIRVAAAQDLAIKIRRWLRGPMGRGSPLNGVWSEADIVAHAEKVTDCRFFVRRAHRLAVERTLCRLSVPPKRYTGQPNGLLGSTLKRCEETFVHARRDKRNGWVEASAVGGVSHSTRNGVRPEEFVLRWFVGGRGRKEQGWDGRHCEGSWVSTFAAIILHDAIYDIAQEDVTGLAWLSPFQGAPSDYYNPSFYERKKDLIEACLQAASSWSHRQCIAHVARVLRELGLMSALQDEDGASLLSQAATQNDAANDDTEDATMARNQSEAHSEDVDGGASPLTEDEGMMAFPTQEASFVDEDPNEVEKRDVASQRGRRPAAAETPQKVQTYAGPIDTSLPLFRIASCLPLKPFCELLRTFLSSPAKEGHQLRFSGFPDLVCWRLAPADWRTVNCRDEEEEEREGAADGRKQKNRHWAPRFIMCEVKSPSDQISEKQLEKADLLIRCGFEVQLCHVVDSENPTETKLLGSRMSAFEQKRPKLRKGKSTSAATPLAPIVL